MSLAEQPLVQMTAALIYKTGPPLYVPAVQGPSHKGIGDGSV